MEDVQWGWYFVGYLGGFLVGWFICKISEGNK